MARAANGRMASFKVHHICDPPIARTDEDDGIVAILNEERMGLWLRHFSSRLPEASGVPLYRQKPTRSVWLLSLSRPLAGLPSDGTLSFFPSSTIAPTVTIVIEYLDEGVKP